jgi:hypothetical protein
MDLLAAPANKWWADERADFIARWKGYAAGDRWQGVAGMSAVAPVASAMTASDPCFLSVAEAASLIAAKRLSPVERSSSGPR